MNVDLFLDKLEKVKTIRKGEFKALCPVHPDKTPSLGIRVLEGERIVMHCFGCGANGLDVCETLGIDPSELFPPTTKSYKREKPIFPASMVLDILANEATVLECAAYDIVNKIPISEQGYKRLMLARARIVKAIEVSIA